MLAKTRTAAVFFVKTVLPLLTALAALGISIDANHNSRQALSMAHQRELPIICVNRHKGPQELVVINDGGPAIRFYSELHEILELDYRRAEDSAGNHQICIQLSGYYEYPDNTFSTQGLLQTFSYQGAPSYIDSVEESLEEAAEEDGYDCHLSTETIAYVSYQDYSWRETGQWWEEYFRVGYGYFGDSRGRPIDPAKAEETVAAARANSRLAREQGLDLSTDDLDGAELWRFCLDQIIRCN